VDLTISPFTDKDLAPRALAGRIFEDKTSDHPRNLHRQKQPSKNHKGPKSGKLEQELHSTREYLQATIEELETSNEELKSANEELQSVNEEMQSANEELETSKEELQSTNEELNTVNTELQTKCMSFPGSATT
jgi:two-component system, chemotaxis family, CheB/CheR fusion protein